MYNLLQDNVQFASRKFNFKEVLEMFQNDLKFRTDNKINTIIKDFDFVEKETALELYPRGYIGVDKIRRPINLEHAEIIKIKEMTSTFIYEIAFYWMST